MFKPEDLNATLKSDDLDAVLDAPSSGSGTPHVRRAGPDRHLAVSPLDLRQAHFPTTMRGYSKAEVTSLLLQAADDFEYVLRENERLRQEITRIEGTLTQFRELESSLKNTLLSAQKVADDMRGNASQEAARIVREAEGRADLLVEKAQVRVDEVLREMDGLRLKRHEVEQSIETIISSLNYTLEYVREQDRKEREGDKVVQHRPRTEAKQA